MIIREENVKWHLEAFASELFIYIIFIYKISFSYKSHYKFTSLNKQVTYFLTSINARKGGINEGIHKKKVIYNNLIYNNIDIK